MRHKGCIMEIRKETMIIMAEDCSFYEIKKRNATHEGMEIEFDLKEKIQQKKHNKLYLQLAVAAVILLFITSIYGLNSWHIQKQPVALITVDINPSLQIEINSNNKVINTLALNKEAENLHLSDLKDRNVREALDMLLQEAKEKGYIIKQEENYILFTTVTLDEDRFNVAELGLMLEEIKKGLKTNIENEKIEIVTLEASKDVLERAEQDSVSVGKLKMYEEIKASSNTIVDLDTLQKMRVKELILLQNENDIQREHPVFEEHPGNRNNVKQDEASEKQHPVFDQHPGQSKPKAGEISETEKMNKKNENKDSKKSREHPVFDQHPRDRKSEPEK